MSEINKPRQFTIYYGESGIQASEIPFSYKDREKRYDVIELAPVLKIIKELVEALEHYESVREYKNLLKKEYELDI